MEDLNKAYELLGKLLQEGKLLTFVSVNGDNDFPVAVELSLASKAKADSQDETPNDLILIVAKPEKELVGRCLSLATLACLAVTFHDLIGKNPRAELLRDYCLALVSQALRADGDVANALLRESLEATIKRITAEATEQSNNKGKLH